jgi:general secretion pathway protein D
MSSRNSHRPPAARPSSRPGPTRRVLAPRALVVMQALALTVPLGAALPARAESGGHPADRITLNFVNADIEAVSRAMGAILNRPIVVDPRVKGTITLYSEQPLTQREAFLNFMAALRGQGFTVVEVSNMLKVVPEADAKLQTGTVSVGAVTRSGDQIITQIFRLQHENANAMVTVLRPLISPNNTINANPESNSLVITDYADNLQRIAKIIAAMDIPSSTDMEIIPLRHAVASDVAAIVQKMGETGNTPTGVVGLAGAATTQVIADPRTNSIYVKASSPSRLESIKSLVTRLDQPSVGGLGGSGVYVVYLKNADAVKLATVLRAAFASEGEGGGAAASTSTSTPNRSSPAAGVAANALSTSGTSSGTSSSVMSSEASAPLAASEQPSTGGFIQADPGTNSLIITASEPVYQKMRAVIDQLDSRRAQIYIESMVVEVSGNKAADFGFQWQGLIGHKGDKNGIIAGSNFSNAGANILNITSAAVTGSTTNPLSEGLNIGLVHNFAGKYGLAAIANFLESQDNTNIISTPNLVTMDNEEAKIVVGQNVPFVTGQYTNTGTGTTNPFQTIERQDVGLTLRIKPQVGEGDTVRLTIYQESSSLASSVAPGTSNAGPTTNKRSIESTVTVDDGQIIVLGGLIEDKIEDNRSKVPLLGDLPLVGNLFRSETRTKTRTNLMVFLRPVVMRDQSQANEISLDRYDLMRSIQEKFQPEHSVFMPNAGPTLPALKPGTAMHLSDMPGQMRVTPSMPATTAQDRNLAITPAPRASDAAQTPGAAPVPAPAASDASAH